VESSEPAGETVIRSASAPLSGGSTTVSRARIDANLPASASETLALVPGMRIVQHGSEGKAHQLFLRGFDAVHGSDVEVTFQGIPLNERANVHGHGYVDLYGLVPEAIRSIRVEKGPFLPEQGDFATAGTIRFETGLPESLRPGLVRVDLSHRGRARSSFVVAPPGGAYDAFAAGEAVYDNGFGPERQATRGAALGSWSWEVAPGLRLGALGLGQGARWQSPGAVRLDDVEAGRMGWLDSYGAGGRGRSWRGLGGMTLSWRRDSTSLKGVAWGGARGLELDDDFTGYLLNGDVGDLRRQAELNGFAGAQASLEQDLPWRFPTTVLAGLGWRFDQAGQDENALTSDGIPWRTDRDLTAQVHGLHAYAGARLQPWHWLDVLPSVRGDLLIYRVNDRLQERQAGQTLGVVSPRVAVSVPIHERLTLFADYGRGFRSPEPRSIAAPEAGSVEDAGLARYRGGRPSIAVADAAEVGLEVRPLDLLTTRVTGFGTFIQREIVFDHVSNTNLEQNGTRRLGVEAAMVLSPWSWVRVQADATWCDARFRSTGHAIPGSSAWSGHAAADLGLERGPHGGGELSWTGRRSLAHGASAAGYALLDLRLGYRTTRYDAVFEVENATAAEAMDGAYHYASWFDTDEARSVIPVIHYTATRPVTARLVLTAYF
jgi:hypothetical protein